MASTRRCAEMRDISAIPAIVGRAPAENDVETFVTKKKVEVVQLSTQYSAIK